MSDDEKVCCVLGICCPAGSTAQRLALRDAMEAFLDTGNGSPAGPGAYADYVLDHYDLAPKGSMTALTQMFRHAAKAGKL